MTTPTVSIDNPKSMGQAYLRWLVFGLLGAHRFYLNRRQSGIGYIILTAALLAFTGGTWFYSSVKDISYEPPIALMVFGVFVVLFWIFDAYYTSCLLRKCNDPTYEPVDDLWQPFIDLIHAPRALWGINLSYCLEGWVYFGMLGYLAMHFSDFIFSGVADPDIHSHHMVMVLTAGITISMFFLGGIADKRGVRNTLTMAFIFLLAGRIVWSGAPNLFSETGLWSGMHLMTMAGILLVVVGYGMYQPAAYAGVRQFTSPKNAAMSYAMLYALMNLGGWLPSFFSPIRERVGISGAFWVYTSITVVALISFILILTRRVESQAIARAAKETKEEEERKAAENAAGAGDNAKTEVPLRTRIPLHLWITLLVIAVAGLFLPAPFGYILGGLVLAVLAVFLFLGPRAGKAYSWLANHPLGDLKFFFFIFALIPVQTLFTYNWLILPQYLERGFQGSVVSDKFEVFANLNPILIFFAVPMVTALTQKRNVYNMMIIGTFVMAAPAFLLSVGTTLPLLLGYLFIMTIGEAMWQPRFLQYAAEIAPEGRTGAYMGVAQFPWFLTKMLVPLYSGFMLQKYVPSEGLRDPEGMWLIFAGIAMISTILLIIAKGWVGRDFKTKAD